MFKVRREHLDYMKNRYLTRVLCITLVAAMVLSSPMYIFASENQIQEPIAPQADNTEVNSATPTPVPEVTPDSTVTPTPEPEITPDATPVPEPTPDATPTPDPGTTPDVTPTPDPGITPDTTPTPDPGTTPDTTPTPDPGTTPDATPTPDPGTTPDASVTPTPDAMETPGVSATPTPSVNQENVKSVLERIQVLAEVKEFSLAIEPHVKKLRADYDALSTEEKLLITNYEILVDFENKLQELKKAVESTENAETAEDLLTDGDTKESLITDGTSVQIGNAVYYTDMVSNLHAGKDFYLESLKNNYQLTFAENFSAVMDEIEANYKAKNKLVDGSDKRGSGLTASSDTLLVRNWQDIIAVYVYEQSKAGVTDFVLDASCKEDLARIFEELNPVVRDKQNITHVSYANRHINYYIKKNNILEEDRQILKKYVETDCKLLCATVTAARGFVRQSVGDDVSEERVNVIAAAYSLVGKVGYFWGGKSSAIGEDASWGTAARVTAEGSTSTGTLRAYGLDCSGFVTWAVINGYKDQGMESVVGHGTSVQWVNANVVSEADAQPGDLVFEKGPEAGSDNHVGIICGKTDAGDWIAVHCSSGKNGVTVGEAYGASFRYIRQPAFYPTEEELSQMISAGSTASNSESLSIDATTVTDSLAAVISSAGNTFTSDTEASTELVDMTPNDEIIVSFEDADTAVVSAGTAAVTDSLAGIISQNTVSWENIDYAVTQKEAAVLPVQPDYSNIEISFAE